MALVYSDIINRQVELSYVPPQNFFMVIDKLPSITFNCQQLQLPTISAGEAAMSNRYNPGRTFIPGDGVDYGTLNATFLLDKEFRGYLAVLAWIKGHANPEDTQQFVDWVNSNDKFGNMEPFSKLMSDITVFATDAANQPLVHWQFKNCFPISLDGPQFDTTQPDINYLTSSVDFRYHYFTCHTYTNGKLNDMVV